MRMDILVPAGGAYYASADGTAIMIPRRKKIGADPRAGSSCATPAPPFIPQLLRQARRAIKRTTLAQGECPSTSVARRCSIEKLGSLGEGGAELIDKILTSVCGVIARGRDQDEGALQVTSVAV